MQFITSQRNVLGQTRLWCSLVQADASKNWRMAEKRKRGALQIASLNNKKQPSPREMGASTKQEGGGLDPDTTRRRLPRPHARRSAGGCFGRRGYLLHCTCRYQFCHLFVICTDTVATGIY